MNETVAIVGTHPDTRENAPYDDPNVDIWVFNEAANKMDSEGNAWAWRVDAVFQIHLPIIYKSRFNRSDPRHWEWLQEKHDFPIYMIDTDPDVPSSVKYPLDEVCDDLLGNFRQGSKELEEKQYFTTSISYAVALAIHKGYKRIKIYGVEMASDTEYIYQRDNVAFWEGVAVGKGGHVDVHCQDSIFQRPLYGYNSIVDHRPEDFEKHILLFEKMVKDARKIKHKADERLHENWENGKLSEHISELSKANMELGKLEGGLGEQQKYQHKIADMFEEHGIGYIDRNEFEGSAAGVHKDARKWAEEIHRTAGRVDLMLNSWMYSKNPASLAQLKELVKNHCEASYKSGHAMGVFEENVKLARQMDELIKATGGEKAVEMIREEVGLVDGDN